MYRIEGRFTVRLRKQAEDFSAILIVDPQSEWLDGLVESSEVLEQAVFTFKAVISQNSMDYDYAFLPPPEMDRVDGREIGIKEFPLLAGEEIKDLVDADDSDFVIPENAATGKRLPKNRFELSKYGIESVTVHLFIYDLERFVLQKITSDPRGLRDYLGTNGGIRVYRDGVRVYDYDEPGNDWLDLGGKRVNVPARRIGNNQVPEHA